MEACQEDSLLDRRDVQQQELRHARMNSSFDRDESAEVEDDCLAIELDQLVEAEAVVEVERWSMEWTKKKDRNAPCALVPCDDLLNIERICKKWKMDE